MRNFKNCILCIKTVFHYAPVNAVLSIICYYIPAFFTGLRMLLMQYIVDSAVALISGTGTIDTLIVWGVLLVVMLILWASMQQAAKYELDVIGMKLSEKMAPDMARRLAMLEYAAFEEQGVHEVFQKMSDEPEKRVKNCFYRVLSTGQAMVSLISGMAVFFSISVWIGLGVIIIGIPMMAIGYYTAGREVKITEEAADVRRRMTDLKGLLTNKHAMFEMKLFGAEELVTGKWNYYGNKQTEITMRENKKIMLVNMGSNLLSLIYLVFLICMVGVGLINGSITLGQFTGALNGMANVGVHKFSDCCTQVSNLLHQAMEADFYTRFMEMDTRKDLGNIDTLKHYDIAFENVSFTYPGTDREILKNVTFYVKEGENIAFVGENGAGKSTIIKLLCGLYEPTTGNVTIGGVPVRELTPRLRNSILSVVFQDFRSYQMTLRENVAFGNLGAINDDDKLKHALCLAGAEELATSEEKGIDRSLGKLESDGQDLSKGQWQRVAMARAFVSDAKYVILDEPTASLDPLAESNMYENFAKIFKKRGTIMISHRLASAKMADCILVLDGGRIVQKGSHDELMKKNGLYQTMFVAQSSFYQDGTDEQKEGRG